MGGILAKPIAAVHSPPGSDGDGSGSGSGAARAEAEKKTALQQRLFADETVPTFFRRLAWSPEGSFLVAPCGIYKDNTGNLKSVAHVFARTNLDKPALCLPTFVDGGKTGQDPAVAVRFNPHLYKLPATPEIDIQNDSVFFDLPYRVVFAVASLHAIAVYDTSSQRPIAIVHGLHCAAITDLAWSPDGKTLAVSSHDGFCSMIRFKVGQFGDKLDREADLPECMTDAFISEQIKAYEEKPKKTKLTAVSAEAAPAGTASTKLAPAKSTPAADSVSLHTTLLLSVESREHLVMGEEHLRRRC